MRPLRQDQDSVQAANLCSPKSLPSCACYTAALCVQSWTPPGVPPWCLSHLRTLASEPARSAHAELDAVQDRSLVLVPLDDLPHALGGDPVAIGRQRHVVYAEHADPDKAGTIVPISKMSPEQYKAELRARNLPTEGARNDLKKRVQVLSFCCLKRAALVVLEHC